MTTPSSLRERLGDWVRGRREPDRSAPAAPPTPEPEPAGPTREELLRRIEALERQQHLAERYDVSGFWRSLDRAYDTILPGRRLTCIVCGHAAPREGFEIRSDQCLFGGGHLERYGCPVCDTVFGPMKYLDLDSEMVDLDYQLVYTRHAEADLTEVEVHVFHEMNPRRDGLYLNWGCGAWSKSVEALRGEGWNVWGFEPHVDVGSPYVLKSHDQFPGLFDGIFSNNVIEHFLKPVAEFEQFRRFLKPGGVMVHASPCYVWSYAYTRFHTYFPLGRSPEVLAKRAGFTLTGRGGIGQYLSATFQADP
jgi:SAM-dependent methyltransferase